MRMCDSQLFLSCRCSGLAGADPNGLFKVSHDDFSVADTTGPRDIGNGLEHGLDDGIVYRNLEFRPRSELSLIHFSHCHALHAQLSYGMPQLVQLEGPNDCRDDLHDVHFAMQRTLVWMTTTVFPVLPDLPVQRPNRTVQNPCHGPVREFGAFFGPMTRIGAPLWGAAPSACTIVVQADHEERWNGTAAN